MVIQTSKKFSLSNRMFVLLSADAFDGPNTSSRPHTTTYLLTLLVPYRLLIHIQGQPTDDQLLWNGSKSQVSNEARHLSRNTKTNLTVTNVSAVTAAEWISFHRSFLFEWSRNNRNIINITHETIKVFFSFKLV